MLSKMSRVAAIFCFVMLFFIASVVYAQPKGNPPGPKGGRGAGPVHKGGNPPGLKGGPGAGPKMDRDNNPPGPVGGEGTNWENPPGRQGGPGAGADKGRPINPPGPKGGPGAGPKMDRDNNPPGPVGGEGTNWENPLAEQNSQGATFDGGLREKAAVDEPWEKAADANSDGVIDAFEAGQWKHSHGQNRDLDNNPPGSIGGEGTNWENPPGPEGGTGTGPDMRPANPPGPMGGPGVGPGRKPDNLPALRGDQGAGPRIDRDNNPPGLKGGRGTNWENPPGRQGGPGAKPDRKPVNPPGPKGGQGAGPQGAGKR